MGRTGSLVLAGLAAVGASPALAQDVDLHLICEGATAVQVPTSQTTGVVTTNRGGMAVGSSVTTEAGAVAMTVQFRIRNGLAELSTPAYSGVRQNKSGWAKVKDLVTTDDEFAGKVGAGWIGSSRFRIDRRTGTMTSSGGYQGQCRRLEQSERQF